MRKSHTILAECFLTGVPAYAQHTTVILWQDIVGRRISMYFKETLIATYIEDDIMLKINLIDDSIAVRERLDAILKVCGGGVPQIQKVTYIKMPEGVMYPLKLNQAFTISLDMRKCRKAYNEK